MKRFFIALFIIVGVAALFLAGVYLFYCPEETHFPVSTKINDVDVSGLTIADGEIKLAKKWNSNDFIFKYNGETYNVPLDSLTYDIDGESIIPSLTRQERFRYFFKRENTFTLPLKPQDSEEFLAQIAALPICDNTGKTKTKDAYVDLSDFEFRIVKEEIGTEIDPKKIERIAYKNITDGIFTADLTNADIVKTPEVIVGSLPLTRRLKYCQDNLSFKVEYDVNGETKVLTPQQIEDMVVYKDAGPEYDAKKVKKFVNDLAAEVNEYNQSYPFTTTGGSNISVKAVTFGQVLDKDAMVKSVKRVLKAQKDTTLKMQWAQQKYSGGKGIGNSYIEVSISGQHVWLYKNGSLVVDCDCVSGIPGHDTVRGLYVVQYVTGPTTLRGENDDGSTYESPVNCFVPFYAGQGFHGSNGWRSEWGGDIYLYSGSHGCVNCPDAAAKRIADNVTAGYPVVIY